MTLGGTTVVEEVVRDGSYVSDFQFDPPKLAALTDRIDDLSFVDLLDVGPGTGFGTTTPEPHPPDAEHLHIVSEAVSDTGLTTLLLPGVAGPAEIDLIAAYESAFDLVRVGVDADDPLAARPLLRELTDLDVRVSLNLLKTYLVSPTEAADAARTGVELGADTAYVVDSAGGFTPADVEAYVTAMAEVDAAVGYHGHDNVGFGLANARRAIDCGASYVDASLQGLGRSAGNTQTELLAGRYLDDVSRDDWRRLREIEGLLEGVYPDASGVAVDDVLYGLADFHSGFSDQLRALAAEYGAPFVDLLVFAAEHDCATVDDVRSAYEAADEPAAPTPEFQEKRRN
ncbi:hypothetical protein [Halosimplex pelagicum]|uniref:Pyruvate carboxyltransferase domain-containing protein n=1 Tax=Halosimplex pelagicum TaxID=869886 RepID=A0A7D5PBZ1_9EURY|nr:hypothetical protein [Halosimplex pelagicum]QLH82642.1 hypothetical protein HZS54_13875 [Halosimplex pelagicum]